MKKCIDNAMISWYYIENGTATYTYTHKDIHITLYT